MNWFNTEDEEGGGGGISPLGDEKGGAKTPKHTTCHPHLPNTLGGGGEDLWIPPNAPT